MTALVPSLRDVSFCASPARGPRRVSRDAARILRGEGRSDPDRPAGAFFSHLCITRADRRSLAQLSTLVSSPRALSGPARPLRFLRALGPF